MPILQMREVLMHELRLHRVSADQLAAYLLVMADSAVPCPRCYAQGLLAALRVASSADGAERGTCEQCSADFVWRLRQAGEASAASPS